MADLVEIERRDSIAIVRLRAGKANALTVPLLDAIEHAFATVEASDAGAVVLTGEGKAFSAGLALPTLIDLDRAAMRAHIARFEAAMRRVLAFPRATVAAINGHAIAGGCVLALMCDRRVIDASGGGTIGLNELRLGIGLPSIVVEPLRHRVPAAQLGPIALEGRLFDAEAAVACGLVDGTGSLDVACELARGLAGAPVAYAQIKAAVIRPILAEVDRAADRESWLDTWFSERAQGLLRAAVDRITAPR